MIETTRTTIIAEAGVNHNGMIDLALELVDRAAEAGADFVKFQTFKAARLAAVTAPKAAYQKTATGADESQLDMLRRLELSPDAHRVLIDRCAEKGIAFLSTAGETGSLAFLADDLRLDTIKFGSGELTNAHLLLAAARTRAHLFLSTGMGSLAEVEEALGVLAFGILRDGVPASRRAFAEALLAPEAWERLRERVTLLHCTTEYPAPLDDTNLRAMDTMAVAFGLPVGYSDHSEGIAVSIAAVARGAVVIEKHFTLDRAMEGPDHAASLEPDEFAALVAGVRAVERALGNGIKQPSPAEVANRPVVRRSVMAARAIPAGRLLNADDLTVKRPGTGISAMDYWDCLGRRLAKSVEADTPLQQEDFG